MKKNQNGFTLFEIIAVLPIVIVIVLVLITALFNQYANSLAESTRLNLRTAGQTLLINLQDELLFTIAYGEEIESRLSDPHEPVGGWRYDTNPQTLIINEIAIDSTRRDETRNIVRQRVNNCETSSITANPLAINNVIYFIENNPDSNYNQLKKRTLAADYNLCSINTVTGDPCTPTTTECRGNAKETTCPEFAVGLDGCTGADLVLTENVVSMELRYFTEGNIETTIPSAAEKIEVELVLGDKVFGKEVEATVKHTIRKIN
mgnify:CR=1 FL=1